MGKHSVLKTHIREASLFKRRALISASFVVVCMLALVIRLGFLQLSQHQFYSTLSQQNLLSIVPLRPARGLIYDRNGVLLATNIPSYSLAIIPEKTKNITNTLTQLQKILPISTEEIKHFHKFRYRYRPFDPIPLKMKLTEKEIARFYVDQYKLPGVIIQARSMRYYPQAEITSDVVGYVGRINREELQGANTTGYDAAEDIGKTGIEKYYESTLHGTLGAEEAEINATGHIVRTLKRSPATAGKNLYLTIDSALQAKAHAILGAENGAIVAIAPQTGEVLALVSHPSFDPNLFVNGISNNDYQKLITSPEHPLYNRAIQGQFAPGSTVKPFIAVSILDSNFISPNFRLYDRGWFQLPNTNHVYHDWKISGHGWVNVTQALEYSCDTFFYNIAVQLGINRLNDILRQFGFGTKTGIDLPGETAGLVPSPQWKMKQMQHSWYTGDTIESGIGQGFFLATPIQLALATATLANRGLPIKPHLLLQTTDENQHTELQHIFTAEQIQIKPDSSAWDTTFKAMQLVVDSWHGTAHSFGVKRNYTVAAKTGTAQVYGHTRDEERTRDQLPKHLRNNHLFIAFAPVDHPQLALAIVVEHSAHADHMARAVFDYYFANCVTANHLANSYKIETIHKEDATP